MRVAPAQDAVIVSPNGGTFKKFQTPFVVSEADVDAGVQYVVDLVFNPRDVIRGGDDANAFSMSGSKLVATGAGKAGEIYVPMLSLAPVPRRSTETDRKETYTLTTAGKSYSMLFRCPWIVLTISSFMS